MAEPSSWVSQSGLERQMFCSSSMPTLINLGAQRYQVVAVGATQVVAKHMPPSIMLVKHNKGNELLVSAAFMWERGDKNGLPRNSSVDAAEPLNQFRLLFHIYYSYFSLNIYV